MTPYLSKNGLWLVGMLVDGSGGPTVGTAFRVGDIVSITQYPITPEFQTPGVAIRTRDCTGNMAFRLEGEFDIVASLLGIDARES